MLMKMGLIKIIHKVDRRFLSIAVKHNPNKNEDAFITVEARGKVDNKERIRRVSLSTFSDYHTTAMVTASLAKIILQRGGNGVIYPFEVTNFDEVLSVMNCSNVLVEDLII